MSQEKMNLISTKPLRAHNRSKRQTLSSVDAITTQSKRIVLPSASSLIEQVMADYAGTNKIRISNVVICTHAKYSTVELCRVMRSKKISITFRPVDYSKEEKYLDQLLKMGVNVVETDEQLLSALGEADCCIEDGARISKLINKERPKLRSTFYAVEQTSGGIRHFEEYAPDYPVINVAMSSVKLDIENRRATPEGVLRYFASTTGWSLGGKNVLVLGFGSIGEGIARLARTHGANVSIYDQFATKRLFAKHRGYSTVEKAELDRTLMSQDAIFMATNSYQGSTLDIERFLLMKDGTVVCNAGSGRGEVSEELQKPGSYKKHDASISIVEKNDHLTIELSKGGLSKQVTILAKSFPINLHIGNGTSHDAIEVVMSLLLLAALRGPETLVPGIQPLDSSVEEKIAGIVIEKGRTKRTVMPHFVKTNQLTLQERAYGGIYQFHGTLESAANHSVVRAWFKAGRKTRGHYHRQSQEAYYAESGSADIILWHVDTPAKKVTYTLKTGDYLIVPQYFFHDVLVKSTEDFKCLVIATPPFQLWDQFFN
jgi:adenosylhomocysteinase